MSNDKESDVEPIQTRKPTQVMSMSHSRPLLVKFDEEHQLVRSTEAKPLSTKELLANQMIRCLCTSACFLSFVTTAFDVVFVLFCYTPIQKGGLGLQVGSTTIFCFLEGINALAIDESNWLCASNFWGCSGVFPACANAYATATS